MIFQFVAFVALAIIAVICVGERAPHNGTSSGASRGAPAGERARNSSEAGEFSQNGVTSNHSGGNNGSQPRQGREGRTP